METGGATSNERRYILTTAADTFREIDKLAGDARRTVCGISNPITLVAHKAFWAIQDKAQDGLREAIANEPMLKPYEVMQAFAERLAADDHEDCDKLVGKKSTCYYSEEFCLILHLPSTGGPT